MKVKLSDIESTVSYLLSKLRDSQGNELVLHHDYYWDIVDEELFNPYEDPKNITLGQLSDDLEELQKIKASDDAIPYDLKRIAIILRALSIENPIAF